MSNKTHGRRIRLGMVGGGNDAFIGGVHRIASRIDDRYELVAGALSSTPEKSRASGEALGLPRIYDDFKTMAQREARRKDGIEAVSIVTPGRQVDDNAHVMLRFAGGARGMLWSSQVAPGNENSLRIRVYGEKGGLEWAQEDPNYLWHTPFAEPKRLLTRGGAGAGAAAERVSRIPAGHPEGYLEGFANLYTDAAEAIIAARTGATPPEGVMFPGIRDGLRGVQFVSACVKSSGRNAAWVEVDH